MRALTVNLNKNKPLDWLFLKKITVQQNWYYDYQIYNCHLSLVLLNNIFIIKMLIFFSDVNSLPTLYANRLDPDQARQNIRPDLDPNCLAP